MRIRFDEQLEQLNEEMINMGNMIEASIGNAVKALMKQDEELAKKTMAGDEKIDRTERKIEDLCLRLLLQQQPVARDLRNISSALKMVTDMRRIGEVAGNIAEILNQDNLRMDYDTSILKKMAAATKKMVSNTLDAFVKSDIRTAQQVERDDDQVDELFAQSKHELIQIIRNSQDSGEQAIDYLMIAKYFEKIGDHAVNISQWVLFMITGTLEEDSIHDILRGGRS